MDALRVADEVMRQLVTEMQSATLEDEHIGQLMAELAQRPRPAVGMRVSVIDLCNPTRSDGFNLLTPVNHNMDESAEHPDDLAVRAKTEKYAKILSKTMISPDGDTGNGGRLKNRVCCSATSWVPCRPLISSNLYRIVEI